MSINTGRDHLAIPGPSVVPSRVLQAMHRPAPNIYTGALVELTESILDDLNRIANNSGDAVIYIGNGHAVWEAVLINVLAPGERMLALASGRFGRGWAAMAEPLGIRAEVMDAQIGQPVDTDQLEAMLRADVDHTIKAVSTVQSDTSTSIRNDINAIRKAMDAAGHPALLLVDAICSFGCESMDMQSMGVDVLITGCQKGLMTPPGLGIVFANEKAKQAKAADLPRSAYWDWRPRMHASTFPERFCGTPPTHHLYGLREALDILLEEGMESVWSRHKRFAGAVWAALDAWGADGELVMHVADPAHRSHAVTAIHTGEGDGTRLRSWCEEHSGVTLGIGMDTRITQGAVVGSSVDAMFRIGHMGHLNIPMLMGTLGAIDTGLKALKIPHGQGALSAASDLLQSG